MNTSFQKLLEWAERKNLTIENVSDNLGFDAFIGCHDLSFRIYVAPTEDDAALVEMAGTFRIAGSGKNTQRGNKNYFERYAKIDKDGEFKTKGMLQTLELNWRIWAFYAQQILE